MSVMWNKFGKSYMHNKHSLVDEDQYSLVFYVIFYLCYLFIFCFSFTSVVMRKVIECGPI